MKEKNTMIERELEWDKKNPQFLQIKDIYCEDGQKLSPALACFFSFLIFKSEKFAKSHPRVRCYIGYSNENLQILYSKWYKTSTRTIRQYLTDLKKANLIIIENETTSKRKIYINYAVLNPETAITEEDKLLKEKDNKIEELMKQIENLKQQNNTLLEDLAKKELSPVDDGSVGQLTQMLFDKKYLSRADNLTRTDCEDFNAMLKNFMWEFRDSDKNFFSSVSYICEKAKGKKIKNKFTYLATSLNNYLNRDDGPLWEDEEDYNTK